MTLIKSNFKESTRTDYLFSEETFQSDPVWNSLEALFNKNLTEGSSENIRIPRIIHQIWLGSQFPEKYVKWQKSWLKYNPGWRYMLWTNKEAGDFEFENKELFRQVNNFGAKSDILRYSILDKFGGMYVDTDFECLTNFDDLHSICDFYTGLMYGEKPYLANGIIGCVPHHPIIRLLCESMASPNVKRATNEILAITGPGKFTSCVMEKVFDKNYINLVLPVTYFYAFPNNKLHIQNDRQKRKFLKPESMAIHHWEVSWKNTSAFRQFVSGLLRYIPTDLKNSIKRTINRLRGK